MHPIVTHIASGQSFFSGTILLLIGIYLRCNYQPRKVVRFGGLLITLGFLLAAISATPFSISTWVLLTTIAILMLSRQRMAQRNWASSVACLWIIAAIFEAVWHFTPRLQKDVALQKLPVVVLADSVTAGLGENEAVTWPAMLQAQSQADVIDLSHVGETVSSAMKRLSSRTLPDSAVFILELGGNDILGSTSVSKFEHDLDQLLGEVCGQHRTVFLFELPLPPFHNRWGRIQRKLCSKHQVQLIPKHRFASVFVGDTSTVDSIHLSQKGHDRMLNIVGEVLRLDYNACPCCSVLGN